MRVSGTQSKLERERKTLVELPIGVSDTFRTHHLEVDPSPHPERVHLVTAL